MSPTMLPASAYEALELPTETVRVLTNPRPPSPSAASPNLLQNAREPDQSLAPNESSITLYAELLLHIRAITLFASLRTVHTRETNAKLSTDGSRLTVSHEGQSATIRLPIKVKGGGDAALSLPAQPPSKELSLRLQIEEKDDSDLLGTLQSEERKANIVPWDGAFLAKSKHVEIHCRSCQQVIITKGRIEEWRDLPNENWAEMMDFWHCHKPDEHHLHDHTHETVVGKKGYAAGNRLRAIGKIGFIDLTGFLLKEHDCEGVEIDSKQQSQDRYLICKHCRHILGIRDDGSEGWHIWKWCINVHSDCSTDLTAPNVPQWISARLLFLIENQGVRKFHVYPESPAAITSPIPSLFLWVFTPDLFYSSSVPAQRECGPNRAMKIFYQHQTYTSPKPGESESASVEEVVFPKELFETLVSALEESQRILPVVARHFQGWQVGLLERFDVMDVPKIPKVSGMDDKKESS